MHSTSTAPRMTAFDICRIVQNLDLETARRHHVEITTVVSELASDAGVAWPWTRDDPTVALLRALARLALRSPDATSEQATSLRARLDDEGRTHDLVNRYGSRRSRFAVL